MTFLLRERIQKQPLEVLYKKKKKFLKISQNSLENIRVSFFEAYTMAEVFSCEFYEIFKNDFFYRTSLVAASVC